MKIDTNLNDMLNAVEVAADWVGLREVYEAHTPRMIRWGPGRKWALFNTWNNGRGTR